MLTELFGGQGWPAEGEELLNASLGPRAPELLLEAPSWLGLGAGQLVLEAGCRDATHAIALTRRYGCRVLGVDLVPAWLPKGRDDAAAAGLGTQIMLVQGDQGMLRSAPGCWGPVVGWCWTRCSPPTSWPRRTGRWWSRGLGTRRRAWTRRPWRRPSPRPGFQVVRRESIASEWSENQLEHDPRYLTQDLLEIARLTRNRDQAEAILGPIWYRRALAFATWRLQIVLGRLRPVLYALRRPAPLMGGG